MTGLPALFSTVYTGRSTQIEGLKISIHPAKNWQVNRANSTNSTIWTPLQIMDWVVIVCTHCIYYFYTWLDLIIMFYLYVLVAYILYPFLTPFSFSTYLLYNASLLSLAYMVLLSRNLRRFCLEHSDIFQKKKCWCVVGKHIIIVLWTLQISESTPTK